MKKHDFKEKLNQMMILTLVHEGLVPHQSCHISLVMSDSTPCYMKSWKKIPHVNVMRQQ